MKQTKPNLIKILLKYFDKGVVFDLVDSLWRDKNDYVPNSIQPLPGDTYVTGASWEAGNEELTISKNNGFAPIVVSIPETDPIVGAVSGIVKADGAGNISASTLIRESGGKIQIGGNTDYIEIEADGTLKLNGLATVFDDFIVPLTSSKLGVNNKPDFDETNLGYLFPQNDTAEILYLIVQMPHKWKEGSDIFPHVHYRRTSAGKPTFKITYSWFNIGSEVSAPGTTLNLDTEIITYTSGNIHQINRSASPISGSGKTISSILLIKLFRDDNTVTGDVLTYQFDIHYEIDSLGSKEEGIK